MKKIVLSFFLFVSIICFARPVFAEYVLPYPSYMPGNKMYRVSRIIDTLKNYWYWGTIAQIKYHLGLSDKYLVEAKTLFEYKQYLLASDALKRSDAALDGILPLVDKGYGEGKDMSQFEKTLVEAMQVHVEKLTAMSEQLPAEFLWTPEKKDATNISIEQLLRASIVLRQRILNELQGRIQQFTDTT